MKNWLRFVPLALLAAFIITGCSSRFTSGSAPVNGGRMPAFELKDLDGKAVSSDSLAGKPVLINFWATWCSYCRAEMPLLQELYNGAVGRGLTVLTVDVGESRETVAGYMKANNLTLPVLLDTNQEVSGKYKVAAYPTTFLIDKDGIIQAKVVGAFPDKATLENYLSKILP